MEIPKNYNLIKKIETLDEFWAAINSNKSIYWRHRMYPSAFFLSWMIKEIYANIERGWFYTAVRKTDGKMKDDKEIKSYAICDCADECKGLDCSVIKCRMGNKK